MGREGGADYRTAVQANVPIEENIEKEQTRSDRRVSE